MWERMAKWRLLSVSYVAALVLKSLAEIYFEQIQFLFCFLEGTVCPDYDDGCTPNTDYRSKGCMTNTEPSTSRKISHTAVDRCVYPFMYS